MIKHKTPRGNHSTAPNFEPYDPARLPPIHRGGHGEETDQYVEDLKSGQSNILVHLIFQLIVILLGGC